MDEVLAVGDAGFQKKCIGKMEDVGKDGRTVLFVSHNMNTMVSLCNRGILLESGTLCSDTSAEEASRLYLNKAFSVAQGIPLVQRRDRSGSGKVRASSFRVLNEEGVEEIYLQAGHNYYFEIGYQNHTKMVLKDVVVSLDIYDERDIIVLLFRTTFTKTNLDLNPDLGYILCGIKNLPLTNGTYRFSIFLSHRDREVLDYIEDAASVTIEGGDFFGTGDIGLPSHCKILAKAEWATT